jgi:deoxyribodipyrimidine photo-lyase
MIKLKQTFDNRQALIDYVRDIAPESQKVGQVSPIQGGYHQAEQRLQAINPQAYGKTRNYLSGAVTGLSPYICHGLINSSQVLARACELNRYHWRSMEKFVQELTWRDFWQYLAWYHPDYLWWDAEPYKTGFDSSEYADELTEDIRYGHTGVACIDAFIAQLINTGYLHNHARMYLASYVIHWRNIRWQAGARWFLHHLLDADLPSNNLSWQWVASTLGAKPYMFNLANVDKFAGDQVDTSVENNRCLHGSYTELAQWLFPQQQRHL